MPLAAPCAICWRATSTDLCILACARNDTLKGAILGGVIGNNVGDIKNGGALGAVIGGMIGHNNSKATGGTQTVCRTETRYTEERKTVYSHSTVTFMHNGRSYTVRFQK